MWHLSILRCHAQIFLMGIAGALALSGVHPPRALIQKASSVHLAVQSSAEAVAVTAAGSAQAEDHQVGAKHLVRKETKRRTAQCSVYYTSFGCAANGGSCSNVFFPGSKICADCLNDVPVTLATFPSLGVGAQWCGAAPFRKVGKGWCRPGGCDHTTDTECKANGFFKDTSSATECRTLCSAKGTCIGYSISGATHGTPNRCYLYSRQDATVANADGLTPSPHKYYDIGASTGGEEVECYHRVATETGKCHQGGMIGGFCLKSKTPTVQDCLDGSADMKSLSAVEYFDDSQDVGLGHCLLATNAPVAPTDCPDGFTAMAGDKVPITRYRGDFTPDTLCMVTPHKGLYDTIGDGWCRPSSCETVAENCHTNALFKDNSNPSQCDVACTINDLCIGFAVSDAAHSDAANRCYLYTASDLSKGVPPGWTAFIHAQTDISSSTGNANAQCYKKAADLCGNTCAQVITMPDMTCDKSTFAEFCGAATPPAGITSTSLLSEACPRECGTVVIDICGEGKTCAQVVSNDGVSCDVQGWEQCPDDSHPPSGFSRTSTLSDLCPRECGKAIWAEDHCEWTKWEEWSACSAECGLGEQTRERVIFKAAYGKGNACQGPSRESRACDAKPCEGPNGAKPPLNATALHKKEEQAVENEFKGEAVVIGGDIMSKDKNMSSEATTMGTVTIPFWVICYFYLLVYWPIILPVFICCVCGCCYLIFKSGKKDAQKPAYGGEGDYSEDYGDGGGGEEW